MYKIKKGGISIKKIRISPHYGIRRYFFSVCSRALSPGFVEIFMKGNKLRPKPVSLRIVNIKFKYMVKRRQSAQNRH